LGFICSGILESYPVAVATNLVNPTFAELISRQVASKISLKRLMGKFNPLSFLLPEYQMAIAQQ
jgi:hypothetical protein